MGAALQMPTAAEYAQRGAPPFGHVKVAAFKQTGIDEDAHCIEGLSSTPMRDRDHEYIEPKAFARNLDRYMANPVVTWGHNYWDIPIGLTVDAKVTDEGLWTRKQIDVEDEFAARVWTAIRNKRVRSDSVGFNGEYTSDFGRVDENGDWVWTDNLELIEIAVVPIPSNPGATFAVAKSLGLVLPERFTRDKGATTFADLPLADPELAWDGTAAERRVRELCGGGDDVAATDWQQYRKAFLWYDPDSADTVGGYKLGIADVIDGKLSAVWRGCAAAMAVLLGGRGGVDIPEDDRKPVYTHLTRYYAAFDREPPEFKGDWPERVKDVTWHNDEPDILEDDETLDYLRRIDGGATWLRNRSVHWLKEGRAPSVRVLEAVTSPLVILADVAKAGEVLSAANLTDLETASEAIGSVLERHRSARARREGSDSADNAETPEDKSAPPPRFTLDFLNEPLPEAPDMDALVTAGAEALFTKGSETDGD